MIEVKNAAGGYTNELIVRGISFHVEQGELFGVIGPNGSGKTTLLKMMSSILPIKSGVITMDGKSVSMYQTKGFAKLVAVLPQHTSQTFSYTVKETVSLGRYAHRSGIFQSLSEEDERVIAEVMEQTGVLHYQDALLDQLSGGEQQRVYLAQALAQNPKILLLDEPTNHLDLAFQKDLLDLLKKMTKEKQLTVISIFHDLNIAGLYCDRLLLLDNGDMKACGTPDDVLKANRIQEIYQTDIQKYPHPAVPKPQIMLVPDKQLNSPNTFIDESCLTVGDDMIQLHSPIALRTMSSGVTGSGLGWNRAFVNRHVAKSYNCANHKQEMVDYLLEHGFDPNETVGMMTAVTLQDVSFQFLEQDGYSIFVVVTAGTGNAVDAAFGDKHALEFAPGTINTWIFINGKLTDEAYIQCVMTATEAKTKVLRKTQVMDSVTGTIATGTSTDSILIAATQTGPDIPFGGSITPVGSMIGKGVFECTNQALANYFSRMTNR
ncbi:adenosylcobinamide amidohydrolase [Virgibacillus ihumii]|uniref:adenosylcobinamide amidohydrolase n=1 Tax=Virgibacillus ihumii TaxID=2686091 RepID=UPI00157C8529|nr:adenosylcobinamide amidohydrolase [Virgibacillus ihumii]